MYSYRQFGAGLRALLLVSVTLTLLGATSRASASAALAQRNACFACHAVEGSMYGPAFREIASRYGEATKQAGVAIRGLLVERVRKGGSGAWGKAAMPPIAVGEADARQLIDWVLAGSPNPDPPPPSRVPMQSVSAATRPVVSPAIIQQGRYLVEHAMGCGNCHAARTPDTRVIPGMELAGGHVYDLPDWFAQPGNLTSDVATGKGTWSNADLVRAIVEGKRPNGVPLAPLMPWNFYKALTPEDAQAIAAYLGTVPPVHNPTQSPAYKIAWTKDVYPDAEIRYDASSMAKDKMLRGRYLAALAHCLDCHTPIVNGAVNFERDSGKGGRRFGIAPRVLATNITSHPTAGIGAWTEAELRRAMFAGVGRDGRKLQYPMPWPYLAGLTQYDQDSLVVWVKSLRPLE